MDNPSHTAMRTLERLVEALDSHDLEAVASCFAEDYRNVTPNHPQRSFQGRDQVRRNWAQLFAGVPDISARVTRSTVDGPTVWTEWDLTGTRRDGTSFVMHGVVIYQVPEDLIESATFYLEPTENLSGDVNAAIHRAVGGARNPEEPS